MREHDRCQGDQAEDDRDAPQLHRVKLVPGPFGDLVATAHWPIPAVIPRVAPATPARYAYPLMPLSPRRPTTTSASRTTRARRFRAPARAGFLPAPTSPVPRSGTCPSLA